MGVAGLLFLSSFLACDTGGSAASRCRTANAFGRMSQPANRTANALEDARCDELERQERAEARERAADSRAREAEKKQADAQISAANAQIDAELAAIRRQPKVPELGSTPAEMRVLCTRQRGDFANQSSTVFCRVGGQMIFLCTFDTESRANRCDAYYEDGDFTRARRDTEARLGPAARESVSSEGFRVFQWSSGAEFLVVTMYRRGVRITQAKATSNELASP